MNQEKTIAYVWFPDAEKTIKIGEAATFELHAAYSDGTSEAVKKITHTGTKEGVFPIEGEYQGKIASPARVIVEKADELDAM
ncbi:hypothetical protein ACFLRM_06960, partial [Acidobacteriota bacterium]